MALAAIAFAAGGCEPSGIMFDDPGINGGYQFPCAGVTPTVARIRVEPSQVNLRVGSQILIAATPLDTLGELDTDGHVITPRPIVWCTATMTAEADGLTAVARIPVTRDPPTRRFRQIATGECGTRAPSWAAGHSGGNGVLLG